MSTPTPTIGDRVFYHHATSDGQSRGDYIGTITALGADNLVDVSVQDGEAAFSRAGVPLLNDGETLPLTQKFCRLLSTLTVSEPQIEENDALHITPLETPQETQPTEQKSA